MKAALPENEKERLEALDQAGLLDTAPEEAYDLLTSLASEICETPIALMTLLDTRRQWFKANVGLDGTETPRDDAFCAHTILQPGIMLVPDALEDFRFALNPLVTGAPNIRFYAGVPLETRDNFRLGSLCVIDRSPRELSDSQQKALSMLGRQVSRKIDLRREAMSDPRYRALELGRQADQRLFHAFMDNSPLAGYLKDEDGRIVYYNQRWADRFHVDRKAWLGKTDADLWPAEIAADLRSSDLTVLREWKTVVQEEPVDPENDSIRWKSYTFPFEDAQGGRYVAGFSVDVTQEKQAEEKIRSYHQALEAANKKLLEISVTDSLTNLPNRRAFELAMDREFALGRRYGQSLSLLLLDIDNFKAFNDGFGHAEGDRVLQCVANIIARSFRGTDSIARYGGEEFAVILPNTPKHSAAESAERLRLAVSNFRLNEHRISVSIGLVTLDPSILAKAELVRRADLALYKAKRSGKNRVCVG